MRNLLTKLSLMFGILALSATPVMAAVFEPDGEPVAQPVPTLYGTPTDNSVFEPDGDPVTQDGREDSSGGEDAEPLIDTGGDINAATTLGESFSADSFFDVFTEFSSRLNAREYTADNVPTGRFGLWWHGVKETVSLAVTFDPVKKAEKQVRFAEERMGMAAAMMDKAVGDEKMQDKALDMIGKAQKFMDKVEDGKSKWLDADDTEARDNLLKDIGTHTALREQAFDRMEQRILGVTAEDDWEAPGAGADAPGIGSGAWDRVSDSTWGRLQDIREQGHMSGRRLMTALENENVPEEIQGHLKGVKQRIETFSEDLGLFKEVKKELLDLKKSGEEGATEALDALHQERKGMLKQRTERLGEHEWLPTVFPGANELRSKILDQVKESAPEFAPRGWVLDSEPQFGPDGNVMDKDSVMINGSYFNPASCDSKDSVMINGSCFVPVSPIQEVKPLIDAIMGADGLQTGPDMIELAPEPPDGIEGTVTDGALAPMPVPGTDGVILGGRDTMIGDDGQIIVDEPSTLDAQRFPDYVAPSPDDAMTDSTNDIIDTIMNPDGVVSDGADILIPTQPATGFEPACGMDSIMINGSCVRQPPQSAE